MSKKNKNKTTTIPEVVSHPTSTPSEQYRTIATNLDFMMKDKNLKTVIITSPEAGAGKTTSLVNIATILSQNGKSVLFIDCDLRKPTAHKRFNLPNTKGLVNIIVEDAKQSECIQSIDALSGLSILTCGPIPPNPSEIINSQGMKNFINNIRKSISYDVILIDTPPALAVNDAKSLSTLTDGVIIVSRYNQTKKMDIKATADELNKVDANILGVIINDLPKTEHDYYYGN